MQEIRLFLNENRKLFNFLVKFGALLCTWEILYLFFLKDGFIDVFLTKSLSILATKGLNICSLKLDYFVELRGSVVIFQNSHSLLRIAHNCNGLILFIVYGGFIWATALGSIKEKINYIFLGFIGIYTINLLRIICLIITSIYAPEFVPFSHKYLYTLLVYGFICFLWYTWIEKYKSHAQ